MAIPRLGLLGSRDLPRSFPNVEVIQTAYDREEAAGSTLHSKDLKVLQAKCRDNPGGPFLCEVTLTVTWTSQDPDQRLVFDVVAVARTSDGGAGYAGADAVPIRTIAKRFFGKDRTQPKREGGMAFRRRPIPVPALTSSADSREQLVMVPRLLGLGRLPDLEQLVVASTTAGRDDDWMKRSPPRYGRSDVREPSGGTFDPRMSDPNATRESCVCRR